MSWLKHEWEGRIVCRHDHLAGTTMNGVVVHDHAVRARPAHVHRYVDVLWDTGEVEEEVHTSGLGVISEK